MPLHNGRPKILNCFRRGADVSEAAPPSTGKMSARARRWLKADSREKRPLATSTNKFARALAD
eukprot:2154044-Pyramimonas_sp.AAC.1